MRKQFLGVTAAAVAATSLGLAATSSPAQAVGGIDGGNISGTGTTIMHLDVAASGPGDAVAAWLRPVEDGYLVLASIATNGKWSAPMAVTPASIAFGSELQVVANTSGDAAVVWTQTINGVERVRGSRYLGGGTWDGSAPLSGQTSSIESTDAAIDDAGRVHVAIGAKVDASDRVLATLWQKGKPAAFTLIDTVGFEPSVAVSPAGAAVLAYRGVNAQADVEVTRRTATTTWTTPAAVSWPVAVDDRPQVGISSAGQGTVLFSDASGDALAATVSTGGSLGAVDVLSPELGNALELSLSVSPSGRALASWATSENGDWLIRSAGRSSTTTGFGSSSIVEETSTLQRTTALVSDRGTQVIVHDDADDLTFRHRRTSIQLFDTHIGGISEQDRFAADMDPQGNVVGVSVNDGGIANDHARADFLDTAGPVSAVTGPGARTLATTMPVKWSASDSLSGVLNTDLIARSSAWNTSGFTAPVVVAENKTASSHLVAGSFGRTYCFEVQGLDKMSNLGVRSPLRCTTIPLDDRHLKGAGWTRKAKAGTFNSTISSTSKKGRVLKRTGVRARRIELVAIKLPTGGVVKVTWNGTSLGTFSLKGKLAKKRVIPVAKWDKVRTGTLRIKVVSKSGRRVHIDGLVVAK